MFQAYVGYVGFVDKKKNKPFFLPALYTQGNNLLLIV